MRYAIPILLVTTGGFIACWDSPASPTGSVESVADFAPADVRSSATVQFGLPFGTVGSPFPPTHDESFHSYVRVHPRTVVIAAGGTVTFEMASPPPHSLAIYPAGSAPGDIDPDDQDMAGLISDQAAVLLSTGITTQTQVHTFETPGRYLVICRVPGHFEHSNMYGWVIVK